MTYYETYYIILKNDKLRKEVIILQIAFIVFIVSWFYQIDEWLTLQEEFRLQEKYDIKGAELLLKYYQNEISKEELAELQKKLYKQYKIEFKLLKTSNY